MPLCECTTIIGTLFPHVFPQGPDGEQARAFVKKFTRSPGVKILVTHSGERRVGRHFSMQLSAKKLKAKEERSSSGIEVRFQGKNVEQGVLEKKMNGARKMRKRSSQ